MNQKLPTLLVVDDKRNMLSLMTKVMKADALILTANSGTEALRILSRETVDVVLCDLKMPDMDGLEVLKACKRQRSHTEFVLMTAFASVGTAIEALKLGAFDYLTKPFLPEDARMVLLQALAHAQRSQPERLPENSIVLPGVFTASRVMRDLAHFVRRIANSEITTLILGETGTGKERIARAVHDLSPRSNKRFVALNCAAIPPELLESELFGHARGSFTGATGERKGLFEEASGGSLFLDEIGDMLPSLQAKLTRVLEERAIRRIGESRERPIDVRLIAATHRDLESMVSAGSFREDLWYRLNVALVSLPPLRERKEDVEMLAHHFLQEYLGKTRASQQKTFSLAALEALLSFEWPGNVRQLRSAVERAAVVSAGDKIELADLPPELLRSRPGAKEDPMLTAGSWAEALEFGRAEVGKRYLEAVLQHYDGQISKAASHAGVERESFYRLLRKHGVDASTFRRAPAMDEGK